MTITTTRSASRRTRITLAALALCALVTGGAITTASSASADTTSGARITSTVADLRVPGEAVADQNTPAIAPDGTQAYSTKTLIAPPRTVGATPGAAQAAASHPWQAARTIASGVRIRTRPVNGAVLALMPREAGMWISCQARGFDGSMWDWVAYNPGNRWIYGYTYFDYVELNHDAYVPPC